MGSAPPPQAVTTDSSLRTTAVAPPPITCFKCQGKGHRASQWPSSNLLIGLEDDAPDYTVGEDIVGDDVYVADNGLKEDCLDSDVIGYIEITSAAPSHSPTAPHGSPVVSIAVSSPSNGLPASRPSPDMIIGARPPSTRTHVALAGPTKALLTCSRPGGIRVTDTRHGGRLRASHIDLLNLCEDQRASVQADCDSGSCVNTVSDAMIHRLELATHSHPSPYNVSWIDRTSLPMRLQSRVPLRVSTHDDIVLCDVLPMKMGSIILGRPWLYDHDVQHAGRANTCSFMHRGRKVVWVPYTTRPTARRLPPPRVGLMVVRGPEFQRSIRDELADTPVFFCISSRRPHRSRPTYTLPRG